jgi:hypothetical protein
VIKGHAVSSAFSFYASNALLALSFGPNYQIRNHGFFLNLKLKSIIYLDPIAPSEADYSTGQGVFIL